MKKTQQKIVFPDAVFNELKAFSIKTDIPMSRILTRLWKKYKESDEYRSYYKGENE